MQLDWLREMESERGVYRVMSSREAQLLVVGECSSSSQEEGGMRGRGTCPILIPKLTERIKEILRRRRLPFSYYCTRSVFIFIYVQYVRIKSKRHHIGSIPPSPTQPQKKEEKKKAFLFFSLSLISYFIARATAEHKQLGLSVSPLAVARISSRQNRTTKKSWIIIVTKVRAPNQ